jgi:hypothetical protein
VTKIITLGELIHNAPWGFNDYEKKGGKATDFRGQGQTVCTSQQVSESGKFHR